VIVARTPRLLLRRWEMTDRGTVDHIYGDSETMRWFGDGSTFTPDEVTASLEALIAEYERFGFGNYAVVEPATRRIIGHAGVRTHNPRERFEADWVIDRAFWRRGYGTEAAAAVIARAFDVDGAAEIWAIAHRENRASIGLMEKLGMTYRHDLIAHGRPSIAYSATAKTRTS
jgi:ribosomal-protein-alanine N-acetyltransferase